MSNWGTNSNNNVSGGGGGGGGGGWGRGRDDNNNNDCDNHYGPGSSGGGSGGGWRRSSASETSYGDNGGSGSGWGRGDQFNGSRGGSGGGGGGWRSRAPGGSGNRQHHGGGGWGQRRQDSHYQRGGGAQRHHPYGNAQASSSRDRDRDRNRDRWSAPTRFTPTNNDGQSALLKRPKLEEEDTEDDGQVIGDDTDMVDDTENCISLEEKVTPETWDSCNWDEKIASQHPDWPDRPPFTVGGKRYLRPGNSIEKVLPSCPFDALKDECRTDEWLRRKKKAAKDAFDKGWKAIEEDDFANCQLNKSEVKKFFDALPYNLVFLVSFDVLGIYAKDETHCYCPCSSKCAMWRNQFGLNDIMDNCKEVDDCGNTFKSSEPHGLMQHLEIKSRNKKGLHLFVELYVRELYGPPYCGSVGHKGLYPKSHKCHREAEAYEKKIMVRAYKKLEGELELERRANEKLEREVKQREEDFKQLEKVSEDLAGRLKDQEKNAKLLNVDVEQMKELEKDMDSQRVDQYYQSYRGIMQGFINMTDMGNKGTGGSVEIKVSDKFKVEELFEDLYNGKKKSFLFKPINNSTNENVAGKIIRDWNVVFDTSKISKLKTVKQETEAVDQGGPSKEFMTVVWKRLTKIKVEAKGQDGEMKSFQLVDRDNTGYSMLQTDDKIENFLNSIPVSDTEKIRKKIEAYYQAIGRLFLHALVSHWHSNESEESGSRLMIPTTALPAFYRQYLLRGCKPADEGYPNYEVLRDINAMGFSMHVKDVIGTNPDIFFGNDDLEPYTDKTFYSKFLHSFYLDNRSIALENVNKGLTLEGHLPLPAILKAIPSKALEKIAFADEGYDSAEDVIAFLEPVYCTEVMVHDEMGVYQREVESQVIESQIHFFEQTLPNLLRDVHASEKADEEKYAKNTRKRKDFLSRFVHYATASSYLPDPGLMESKDKIKIEFDASEMTEDSLPMAHTCVNTLKFPLLVYDNNSEKLLEKLHLALRACSKLGAFGMA